jgi:DNA helicase-2/ATP-dependent DNA helicase PcrA
MDVSHLLDTLNDAQRQAVAAPLGPALVLAGAGSGKTRVLVHRVAWLIQVEGASPNGILAVTFTNKAAGEMRARIESLLSISGVSMWIGTFHGLAHRLLRMHWREAGLAQNFQILDSEDQARVLRKVLKALDLDETRWVPREIQWFINAQKDEGFRPKHLKDDGDATRRQLIRIYQAYEEACQRAGVVDFAELLLRAYEIWRDNPALLQHYRARFRHILIDEFQDTNAIQYKWLTLLAGAAGQPFAVGDDDQSIYRWRGARVENLNQFRRDFPAATLYKLEQNYRSSGTILKAANALIANNAGRVGKTLWTSGAEGELIRLYAAFNERDEADFVVNRIREWVNQGGARRDIAILYRSNAQSRVFEEAFLNARIPYKVYGGLRFFERAEIKDALAYLRLTSSRAGRESAHARHRREDARHAARLRTGEHDVAVGRRARLHRRGAAKERFGAGCASAGNSAAASRAGAAGVSRADRQTESRNGRLGAARPGRSRDPDERAHRALQEGKGRTRRRPHR